MAATIRISAIKDDANGADSGSVYFLLGSSTGGGSVVAPGDADYSFLGAAAGDELGWGFGVLGDLTGDETPDIAMGAPGASAQAGAVDIARSFQP
jgi:hypothetical protein